MIRLLADLLLPADRFDRCALVEVHFRLAQLRNDLLRRVSFPFHRVLLPSRAFRLSYQLVQLEGVIPMYPRLFLARQLLKEEGVIFVSIDDHELHNAIMILNEIFGEEGYLATFVWRRRISSSMASSWISADHEYVLAYSKNPESVYVLGDERDMSKYNIPDGKGRFYASMPLTVGMTKAMRPNQWYELKNPRTGTGYWPPEGRVWGFYPPTMQKKVDEDRLIWPEDYPDRQMTTPRLKTYPEDAKRDRKPLSTWIEEKNGASEANALADVYSISSAKNEEGTRVLKELLGDCGFSYPKPLSLMRSLVEQFTKEDDIILDFFAGSGTTAHAVMEVNDENGGNRKFIMVQMPEPTGNVTFPTISKIGIERLKRVSQKLKEKRAGKLSLNNRDQPDLGFRVFKLAESNHRTWTGVADKDAEAYTVTMALYTDPLVPGWNVENVIWEAAIKEGFRLSSRIEKLPQVKGNTVYRVFDAEGTQSFKICLDDRIKFSALKALNLAKDELFICRDRAIDDDSAANLALQCKLRTI